MLTRASFLLPIALIAGLVAVFLTAQPFDYLSKGAPPGENLTVEHVRLDGGAAFEHAIDVAVATPGTSLSDLTGLALVGLFVGVVPVLIGFAFYPALMSFGEPGRQFALALTVGLLAFLLVDTVGEGLEVAEKAADGLKADLVVWLSALLTSLALLAIGRRGGRPPEGVALAYFIAIGIGVHNLGEGLAIGASFAVGEIALASFLVLGFALHNVTEGIAISAPIRREAMSPGTLVWLAVIAGGPAIPGAMTGGFSISPFWTALAFGVGAGAILQVIIEVGGVFLRRKRDMSVPWYSAASLFGFTAGIVVMYATAFVVRS
jgi:zinc transporter ZupT